jgi:hypothetical protein
LAELLNAAIPDRSIAEMIEAVALTMFIAAKLWVKHVSQRLRMRYRWNSICPPEEDS